VQDLVFTDDGALQPCRDPHQMPHGLLTRFNLEVSLEIWHVSEPVKLHPMTRAEQNHAMTGNPPVDRPRNPFAPVSGHSVRINGHDPRL
jgi:hypothetical protein